MQVHEGVQMDTDSFFNTGPVISRDNSFLLSTLSSFNSLLLKMSVFVHLNGKFITVPSEEVGVLYLNEAYIFLCVYKVIDDAKELEEACEEKSNSLECVLYFLKGRNAARRGIYSILSKIAYATFRFKTQPELEELVKSLYGCDLRVVHVEYGKEPLMLLSHLSNQVVYEKGFRNQKDIAEHVLYRIRIDSKYGTRRACNISAPASYLSKSDSYLIIENNKANLIRSCTISQSEFSYLYQLCQSILLHRNLSAISSDISVDSITPLKEPSFFKISDKIENQLCQPLFFRCSCSLGYYSIEHLAVFSQDDLRPDCVVILDCRPGNFFMWKGKEASDVVIQLSLRAIDQKVARADVRMDFNIIHIEQGKEPDNFSIYFNVWEDEFEPEPTNSFLIKMKDLKV